MDNFLEGEVHEFQSILREEEDEDDELFEAEREIRRELGSRLRGDLTFRLLDRTGRLLLTSDPQDLLPNPWERAPIGEEDHEAGCCETIQVAGLNSRLRVRSHWIKLRDGEPRVAQAAYVLGSVEKSLATFRHVCLATLLAAPAMALVGGYVQARRSLRPVGLITRSARRIGAKGLSQRIVRSGSGDELDRLAETLNDMLDRIEQHVHRMQQFTADASHELRTPLAALRGTTEVALSQTRSAEELRAVLEDSVEHYARLSRIADDLLLLARADAGQLPLTRETICLNRAVVDVVDLYSPLAQERGIELRVAEGPEVWLSADGARIHQLVGNIIDNAVKYAGEGSHITVALADAADRATIKVVDDGPGIACEDLPHVFERFCRADHSRSSRNAGGAGLGLPICRMITELHGGDIRLDSSPGHGTSVVVSLPRKEAASSP